MFINYFFKYENNLVINPIRKKQVFKMYDCNVLCSKLQCTETGFKLYARSFKL